MAEPAPQTYENHRRFIPTFHVVAFGSFAINVLWSTWRVASRPSVDAAVALLVSVALVLLFFHTRLFALRAQDRIIRLEERLRLERLLPPDLRARIPELSFEQTVAIRFASDGEAADLVRRVLDEKVQDREAIKKMIRVWRPDTLRV